MSTFFRIEDWADKEAKAKAKEDAKRCPAEVNSNFVHRLARYDGLTVKTSARGGYALSKGDAVMTRGQFQKLMGLVAPDEEPKGTTGASVDEVLSFPLREWACILMHPTFRHNLGLKPLPAIEEIKKLPGAPQRHRKPAPDEISLFDIVEKLEGIK